MEDDKLFEDYLIKKNIHAEEFRKNEPLRYEDWKNLFLLSHPKSFTMQKLFQINALRRRFILLDKNKK